MFSIYFLLLYRLVVTGEPWWKRSRFDIRVRHVVLLFMKTIYVFLLAIKIENYCWYLRRVQQQRYKGTVCLSQIIYHIFISAFVRNWSISTTTYNQNLPSFSTVRNLKDDCFHFKLGYGSLLVSAYQLTVEVPSKQISITYTLKPITNHSIPVLFTEYHIVLYGWCLIEDML